MSLANNNNNGKGGGGAGDRRKRPLFMDKFKAKTSNATPLLIQRVDTPASPPPSSNGEEEKFFQRRETETPPHMVHHDRVMGRTVMRSQL
ncbi:hypothetical protein QOT17_006304 [Balamuthia mandrillaris]